MFEIKKIMIKQQIKVLKSYIPELKMALKKLEAGKTPIRMEIYGTQYLFPTKKGIKKALVVKEKRLSILKKRLKEVA